MENIKSLYVYVFTSFFNDTQKELEIILYNQTSMARPSLGPRKFVLDIGSSSH